MRYILFAKKDCSFCTDSIEFLEQNELPYKVINFEPEQEDILTNIKKAYEWATVPMIFFRDGQDIKFIGGFTDLQKWLTSGGRT